MKTSRSAIRVARRRAFGSACLLFRAILGGPADAQDIPAEVRHSIAELTPVARIHVGKTADWVAIAGDAVWVGTTGPEGVARIDSHSNSVTASVSLPGTACAGLAVGFGGLWVPLCAKPNALARVDLQTRVVTMVAGVGPADREGGITVSADSVWLVIDGRSTLARIEPHALSIRQRVPLPPGSLTPSYRDGMVWVTRPSGAEITIVDAEKGTVAASVQTGPGPRFLDSDSDSVWTFNQGDGTLTRVDVRSKRALGTTSLRTPGSGGDIKVGAGIVWTTMTKVPLSATDAASGKVLCQWVGPGGDAVGVSGDAIWLTDYDAGDVSRFNLADVLAHCPEARTDPLSWRGQPDR